MGSNHYVKDMNKNFPTRTYVFVASLFLVCLSTGGNACEREVTDVTNSNSISAVVEGTGDVAVALSLSYRVVNDSGQLPGAISVFVRRESSENSKDWLMVDRIFPFAPSRAGEAANAIIAIPEELQPLFGKSDRLVVGLGFEEGFVEERPQTEILELDQATVVFD